MQMADEQQGCSREGASGRIWNTAEWRNNKLDKVFFLLFFIPEHRPQVKVEQMIDRGR